MANKKFKVGDTVRCTCAYSGNERVKNKIGTVCVDYGRDDYGIDFGKYVAGHACEGACIDGHGWCIPSKYLERVATKNAKVIIYSTKNTVVAKLFEGKTLLAQSEAKCSPDDDFNLLTGAQIALLRLARAQHVKPIIPKEALEGFEII